MDRFASLVEGLTAEHEWLRREVEQLRPDAEAWRAYKRDECRRTGDHIGCDVVGNASEPGSHSGESTTVDVSPEEHQSAVPAHASGSDSPSNLAIHPVAGDESESDEPEARSTAIRVVRNATRSLSRERKATHESFTSSAHSSESARVPTDERRSGTPVRTKSLGPIKSESASNSAIADLCPLWVMDEDDKCENLVILKVLMSNYVQATQSMLEGRGPRHAWAGEHLQWLVTGPNSKKRMLWDVVSVGVLTYDILSVPMLAFQLDEEPEPLTKQILDLATAIFWTLDMPASFLSGYHNGGVVEMRPSKIAARYLKGWFLLDLPVVVGDWVITILQSGSFREVVGVSRVSKILRISRILRLFRLLRMLKLPSWAEGIKGALRSESLVTCMGVMRSLLIIVIASHFIACGWYFIGGRDRPHTWVQILDDEGRGIAYRYTTALHWGVTQFTPASMEVMPRNTIERTFSVLVILSAMVAFSCFISSITQAMANLQRAHLERDQQLSNMRQYIIQNGISLELGHRITRFMRAYNVMAKRRVHEGDVQIFRLLPESLRQELHWQVYMPILSIHPLIKRMAGLDLAFLQELCHSAMSEVSLGRTEELFHPGKEALVTYFSRAGSWEYRYTHRKDALYAKKNSVSSTASSVSDVGEERGSMKREFRGEKVVCEVALWLQWELCGYLMAVTPCEAVALDSSRLRKLVQRKPAIFVALQEYANRFQKWMNDRPEDFMPELGFEFSTLDDIVEEALDVAEEHCMSEHLSKGIWSMTFSSMKAP